MPGNISAPERDSLRRLLAEMKRRLLQIGIDEGIEDALVAAAGNAEIREELMRVLGIHELSED